MSPFSFFNLILLIYFCFAVHKYRKLLIKVNDLKSKIIHLYNELILLLNMPNIFSHKLLSYKKHNTVHSTRVHFLYPAQTTTNWYVFM